MTLGPCKWCGSQDRVNIFSYAELVEDQEYPHMCHVVTEICQECKESFLVIQALTDPFEEPWQRDLAAEITGELLMETLGGEQ